MATTTALRSALQKAYDQGVNLATTRSDKAKSEGIQQASRGLSLAGVKGPIAEKVKTGTALSFEQQLADQLNQLGIQKQKGEQDVSMYEDELKRQEDIANMQLISSIFGPIGGIVNKLMFPTGATTPQPSPASGSLPGMD